DPHIAPAVDVRRRPAAGGPGEQRGVQILGGRAPDWAAAWPVSAVETVELRRRQSLDQRKQLALLEADMRLEPLAELAHRHPHVDGTDERGRERMKPLMVEERFDEQRSRLFGVDD